MLTSAKNNIASANAPIIQKGGPSSSDLLNNIHGNMLTDIINLSAQSRDADRKRQMLSILMAESITGMNGFISHLQGLLPAAPANRALADFYSGVYVAGDNTAQIDTDFGQATLPILSTQEKMSGTTAAGVVWVPDDSRLRTYLATTYTSGSLPTDDQFDTNVEDYLGIGNQPDTFFLGPQLSSPGFVFLKAELPQSLNLQNLSNRITFYPIPAFRHTLKDIYVRATNGVWNQLDISYLPGYVGGTGVPYVGPVRVHFAPQEITQVCVVLSVPGWWGVQSFGVQLVEYGPTALLSVDVASYSPGTINTGLAHGWNAAVLNQLPITLTGTKVQFALSQTQAYASPVVTGIEARW